MQAEIAYQIIYIEDDGVKSVAGVRIFEWLHAGKYLEIEDLVTKDVERSIGYGDKIFDWVLNHARENDCQQVRLVSGVARQDAHRFYLKKGMSFEAKYFSVSLG